MMKMPVNFIKTVLLLVTATILVAGWFWWSRDLTADSPLNFSGFSQSLSTDPALYTYHARNRVLFEQADPLGDSRWILFEKSFAGMLATFWFELTSVSISHGRQVGIGLSFGAFILILAGLWRKHRPWVITAVALALVGNVMLTVYGSYPFLEISLLFFSGLVFFLYSWWGDRIWGLALIGAAIAAATFTGKIFGVLLLPAVIACEMLIAPSGTRLKRSGVTAAAFVIVSILLVAILYGSRLPDAFGFLREQTYESKGLPAGLSSPWSFVAHLVKFGFTSDLYFECLDLLWFFFSGSILLMVGLWNNPGLMRQLPRTTVFALCWMLMIWIGLSPLSYAPPRYALTFIPAVVIFCFTLLDAMHQQKEKWPVGFGWWQATGVGLAVWIVALQLALRWYFKPGGGADFAPYVVATFPIGAAFVFIARFVFARVKVNLTRPTLVTIMVISVLGSAASNVYGFSDLGLNKRQYHIISANRDLEFLLGPGAVISGPYAAAFTQENTIKSHPHFFGETWSDSSLLVSLPITHLALDKSNFERAVKQSQSLKSARPVTTYLIGAHEVSVFDISQVYENSQANSYKKSAYEQAVLFYENFRFDSAMLTLAHDPSLIQNSRSAALLYARSMFKANMIREAAHNYQVLHSLYPTDFQITLEAASTLHQISELSHDSTLSDRAMELYQSAVEINPWATERVQTLIFESTKYFETLRAGNKSGATPQK